MVVSCHYFLSVLSCHYFLSVVSCHCFFSVIQVSGPHHRQLEQPPWSWTRYFLSVVTPDDGHAQVPPPPPTTTTTNHPLRHLQPPPPPPPCPHATQSGTTGRPLCCGYGDLYWHCLFSKASQHLFFLFLTPVPSIAFSFASVFSGP